MGGSRAWETDDLENQIFDSGHFATGVGGKLESRPVRGVHTGLAGTQHLKDVPTELSLGALARDEAFYGRL